MSRVLVVDDERNVLSSFERLLAPLGHETLTSTHGARALELAERFEPEVAVIDLRLPDTDGLTLLGELKRRSPGLPVLVMTAFGTTDVAIEAIKLGAFDYLPKPFEPADMIRNLESALSCVRLMRREVRLDPADALPEGDALIGQSPGMQEVYKAIGKVAATDATVLIRGETGTGKELVARAIYQHGSRRGRPLLAVSCTAIPDTLLESELFGHERGAFTGAVARRLGKFELAHGGTLFLDEIGDVSAATQAKLLRVLQERTFERLGGDRPVTVDVRVLAATNRDLERAIGAGLFREDLYHRLDVFVIRLPALRERRQDIPRLVRYFVARAVREIGIEPPVIADDAMALLERSPWPGNVRELRNCLQRTLILTRGYPVREADVLRSLEPHGGGDPAAVGAGDAELARAVREALDRGEADLHRRLVERLDRMLVDDALARTGGNQTRAARLLGLSRPTLQAKMKKYGLGRG